MNGLKIKAMSKINLGLDVLRRREDGYHEVRMVMQTLNLCDELTIIRREDDSINISCNIDGLECDENNLIFKAAKRVMEHAGVYSGLDIHLEKRIPIAAGMAGGSTDAAATLVGINELLNLGLTIEELKIIGVTIGADVPYCIEGGTQLSEGIGEILTKLKPAPQCFVLIAKPHIGVSTKYVYENLHVDKIVIHPDIDGMLDGIERSDIFDIADNMENILENVTENKYPVIKMLKDMMLEEGALNSLMSGSGPTVFGLFQSEEMANRALEKVQATGEVSQACVTTLADRTCVIEELE